MKDKANKVKVWLARNKNGYIFVHFERPYKNTGEGLGEWISYAPNVYDKEFPLIKWEDNEPTEAYITLAEPQEQPTPKQEIDWEQRRYEIAKEMLPVIYRQEVAVSNRGQGIMLKDIADIAVAFADTLISTLKNKTK